MLIQLILYPSHSTSSDTITKNYNAKRKNLKSLDKQVGWHKRNVKSPSPHLIKPFPLEGDDDLDEDGDNAGEINIAHDL